MFSSDEDILNNTKSTLEIFQDCKFETGISSSTCESDQSSVIINSLSLEQSMNNVEIESMMENIEEVNEMYSKLEKFWHSKDESDTEANITDYFADLIETSNIRKTIEKMKSVICHLQIISAEKSKLKQDLRSTVLNDVWPMKKDYHKSVVTFFVLALDLVKNVNSLITALENRRKFSSDGLEIMQNRERKFYQVLNENMDILNELQNFALRHS